MTDNEIAEKLAEKLWPDCEVITNWESWPTFGSMVEDAAKRGWGLCSNTFGISFQKDSRFTDLKFYAEHDHIKACALAFLETFDD